ncbi:carotenoid biosynthesis protein [Sphaerisporangium aureirubrum]|uniref:Carotenoid biosynthesis protein n=1 Tax=Sphaerisporangium aureirubrum TaxID=1544736 RepID=A0ABW1NQ72_9ACTN
MDVVIERDRTAARRAVGGAVGALLLGGMLAAQVVSGTHPAPVRLTGVVVLLLAGSAVAFAAAERGAGRAAAAFGVAAGAGYAAEWIGVRTGVPFGEYRYTGVLWPAPGDVPLVVAVAWGGMGLAAHAVATRVVRSGRFLPTAVTGAFALTAWDLFLDPQMLRLGLWEWADPGPYRGVPLSNLAGWLVVSFLVMALIGGVFRRGPAGEGTGLAALYTAMAVMETIGFAAVFDPPDILVAAVGGAAMGLFAVLGWVRRRRR